MGFALACLGSVSDAVITRRGGLSFAGILIVCVLSALLVGRDEAFEKTRSEMTPTVWLCGSLGQPVSRKRQECVGNHTLVVFGCATHVD